MLFQVEFCEEADYWRVLDGDIVINDCLPSRKAAEDRAGALAAIAGMGSTFFQLVLAGERAFAAGLPITANPYMEGDEDHDSWNFGWEGLAND
jgi:hypothetical protein